MQCGERKVEVKASCYKEDGYMGLSCTSQQLSIIDSASGKELGGQSFKPATLEQGDSYPIVAEKLGDAFCAETPGKQKFIVTMLSNGGNCEQCEWAEIYDWDGKLLGASRDKKKSVEVRDALKAAYDKKAKNLGKADLSNIYIQAQ